MAKTFKGGIHPPYNKSRTAAKSVEKMPDPDFVIIPLQQHIGAPCIPTVAVGDTVKKGQVLGDNENALCCPVHATVSGVVKEIAPKWNSNGAKVTSVVIENDFKEEVFEELKPMSVSPEDYTPEEIIKKARDFGLVGMGGAGFPVYAKLKTALDKKVDTFIINGAECEPFITCDHREMLELPDDIVGGVKLIMHCLGLENAKIAIEINKPDAIKTMKKACENTNIEIVELKTKYPQGGEKQIIRAVTGRKVPPGKLPMDVGCAVFNIDTCASLFRCFKTGIPLNCRVVTVSGDAVKNPKNVLCKIGTPYEKLFDFCENFVSEPYKILCGGPMMGMAQHNLETPVTKNTSALLAFSKPNETFVDNAACIHCGKCMSVCPMSLMPVYINQYSEAGDWKNCEKLNVFDCIECGSCAYTCPAKLPLVQTMRMAKAKLR